MRQESIQQKIQNSPPVKPETNNPAVRGAKLGLYLMVVVLSVFSLFVLTEVSLDLEIFTMLEEINSEVISDTLYNEWVKEHGADRDAGTAFFGARP